MAAQSRPDQNALPLLLTRPDPQGARFASLLQDRFGALITPIATPLLQAVFLRPDIPRRDFQALILTSETGVVAAKRISADGVSLPRRAFCVGDTTAATARSAGFDALSADGDAKALTALVLRSGITGPLLHLHGEHTRGDIGNSLSSGGLETISATSYAQNPLPLSPHAVEVLGQSGVVLAPLFSPRTATIFADQIASMPLKADIFITAMSDAVAAAVAKAKIRNLVICTRPTAASMLTSIDESIQALLYP